MADGQNANTGFNSYLLIGRETTFKTYSTCTAGLDFMSFGMKMTRDMKVIESVSNKRTHADKISLGRSLEGDVEFHMAADSDASQYLLQNAFGGGVVSSASATGDTAGAGVMDHTYSVNSFDATYSSLCLNTRKGDATNGKVFEYCGVRVNELTLTAEVDEPVVCSASLIGVDGSVTSNSLTANLSSVGQSPMSYANTRFSVESTFAALTSTSYWHVQSIEWGISNSLKADSDSRRLGSDILDVMPPGVAQFTLNCSMRFDTLTAYNAMLNETQLAAQIFFQGPTLSGSTLRNQLTLNMPRIFILDAGDPEIGGPDEILKSEITFQVLRDDSSASGYACQAVVRNKTASY